MPAGANSKRSSHSLGTFSPLELGGAKVQFLAAWIAASAKYLLGPGASNAALVTLPEASTLTFTLTRTLPRIVSRAFCETSGIALCATWPRAGVEAGELMAGRGLGEAAAGAVTPGADLAKRDASSWLFGCKRLGFTRVYARCAHVRGRLGSGLGLRGCWWWRGLSCRPNRRLRQRLCGWLRHRLSYGLRRYFYFRGVGFYSVGCGGTGG